MKKHKPRNTLAKIIEADGDSFAALYGRPISDLDFACHTYLATDTALREFRDKNYCPKPGAVGKERIEKLSLDSGSLLSKHLFDAILKRDADALRALADFVEKWSPVEQAVDNPRRQILLLKGRCEYECSKMTVRAVADHLNREIGTKFPIQTTDGLAALRRLLKRLKFPIAPDAKGRPKKETRKA